MYYEFWLLWFLLKVYKSKFLYKDCFCNFIILLGLLNRMPCVPACQHDCVYAPTYLRASGVYVPACLRANVPKVTNFSFLRAKCTNMPNGVPIFQLDASTCQMACQFFKHFSYEMLSELLYFIIRWKILHFTWYHSCKYHTYMYRK